MEVFDFGGYATKYGIKCSDGRIIKPGAFEHADGLKIPLVWQHLHDAPQNILGHGILEHRKDGVYVRAKFNDTAAGQEAKKLVHAKDIESLSIYANKLVEKAKLVHAGVIREVSLVLSGANPGARIDNISFTHNDGDEGVLAEEAIIHMGTTIDYDLSEEDEEDEEITHEDGEGKTIDDVIKTLSEEQATAVLAIIGTVAKDDSTEELEQSADGDKTMKKNVFDKGTDPKDGVLAHSVATKILKTAMDGGTLRQAVLAHKKSLSEKDQAELDEFLTHAADYGIENLENLFPESRAIGKFPEMITRDMGWVGGWMSGVRKTPFSRLKTVYVDLTEDDARAKGYVTAALKVNQVFEAFKRTTDPTTVYKKQKIDRDDVLDITDFSVVAFLKKEMRFMLNEELARACLVSDGRAAGHADKISESHIRPIYGDSSVYTHLITLDAAVTDYADIIDDMILARKYYKGTGSPTLFMSGEHITGMLILKDTVGRRIYRNIQELEGELRCKKIVEVEVFENVTRLDETGTPFTADLIAIYVNPHDYTIGADKGGQVNMFDDFDIDYNQHKYLIETRVSGALVKPKAALAIERKQ